MSVLGVLVFFGFGVNMITHTFIQYSIIAIVLFLAIHGIYRMRKQKNNRYAIETSSKKAIKKLFGSISNLYNETGLFVQSSFSTVLSSPKFLNHHLITCWNHWFRKSCFYFVAINDFNRLQKLRTVEAVLMILKLSAVINHESFSWVMAVS